jgi:predicted ABC-type ATPase
VVDLPEALGRHERFIVVLAGPNGAGKSTFFDLYLARLPLPFVNADLIARTLDPDLPAELGYASAAAADQVRAALVEQGASFCMETVFSDEAGTKVDSLTKATARGYAVILVFIGLENPDLCIGRVSQRVADGGHDVPDEKLRARYPRTLVNLRSAVEFVDCAYLFDNSSCEHPFRLVAIYRAGRFERRASPVPAWAQTLPGMAAARRPRRSSAQGKGR